MHGFFVATNNDHASVINVYIPSIFKMSSNWGFHKTDFLSLSLIWNKTALKQMYDPKKYAQTVVVYCTNI